MINVTTQQARQVHSRPPECLAEPVAVITISTATFLLDECFLLRLRSDCTHKTQRRSAAKDFEIGGLQMFRSGETSPDTAVFKEDLLAVPLMEAHAQAQVEAKDLRDQVNVLRHKLAAVQAECDRQPVTVCLNFFKLVAQHADLASHSLGLFLRLHMSEPWL
jgi:hypothetical protein